MKYTTSTPALTGPHDGRSNGSVGIFYAAPSRVAQRWPSMAPEQARVIDAPSEAYFRQADARIVPKDQPATMSGLASVNVGDFWARIFGENYFLLMEAIQYVTEKMNQAPYCDQPWYSWMRYVVPSVGGLVVETCYTGDAVSDVLKAYANLAVAGTIPEYTKPTDKLRTPIYEPVAAASGQPWLACGYMLMELYKGIQAGDLSSSAVLYPVTWKKNAGIRETPEDFKAKVPGTDINLDTIFTILKWTLIVGAAAGVGYLGYQGYKAVKVAMEAA